MPVSTPSPISIDDQARPHLLIVDGSSILRQVFEAVPGEDTPARAQGAMKSSWASLMRGLRQHEPTHFLFALDTPGVPTWRHEAYEGYKQHRSPMSVHLRAAIPDFCAMLEEVGLRHFSAPGFEGEDILATLGAKAQARGFRVTALSADKDACYLASRGIVVYDHFKNEVRDEDFIMKRFGVPSALLPDYLGLIGDSTDGIPGVSGIGVKTAPKLLAAHGSLEGLLEAAPSIQGKTGDLLRSQKDIAVLSKRLAQLRFDVPMALTPGEIRIPDSVYRMSKEAPRPFIVPPALTADAATDGLLVSVALAAMANERHTIAAPRRAPRP